MTKKKEPPKKATATKKKDPPKKATAGKKKETPKKATVTKKKETPKKTTAIKKKEPAKKATATKKKEPTKKATAIKKKEKAGAKSVSAKTSKQKPQMVKDFCIINLDDVKDSNSEIDTGIILSLSGEPKTAYIHLGGGFNEVTWWGEGGDPAKNNQIDTGHTAMGVLQIKTTTYSEIGEHSVTFEAVSKGALISRRVKFKVKK